MSLRRALAGIARDLRLVSPRTAQDALPAAQRFMSGGHNGSAVTHAGLTLHQPATWHVVCGEGFAALMWFWIFVRAYHDGETFLGAGQLTVADYTQRFLERTLENVLEDQENQEEKQKTAEINFLNLIHKLQEAGHKDDIRVPLRVLRDEIGRIHFHSSEDRAEKIEILFKLYDALEDGAQTDARSNNPKVASGGAQLLEELRQRFSRLVIGDTWDAWPQLKLLALKRMHKYVAQEKESEKDTASSTPPPTPTARLGMRKLSRSLSSVSGSSVGTWNATMEELGKAPGTRLLPLIKLLLVDTEGLSAADMDLKPMDSFRRREGLRSKPSLDFRDSKPPLTSQASGLSETAETSRRISVLEMDDLLGLNDANSNAPKPVDPFAASHASVAGPPTPGQPQTFDDRHSSHAAGQSVGNYHPPLQSTGGQQNGTPGFVGHSTGRNDVLQSGFSHHLAGQDGGAQHFQSGSSAPRIQVPDRADSGVVSGSNPGSFNPFDLPSPTYSSRVPANADNNFADFSPVAGRPHQPPPAPMRSNQAYSDHA